MENPSLQISDHSAPKLSFWSKIKSVISDCRKTFKEAGLKGVWRRYGWKIFAVFFVYYLIRDLTIYVLIPYLIAQKLMQ